MLKKLLLFSGICVLGSGAFANADTIGPGSGCASCAGSSYTLSYTTTANPDIFDVTLVVDATGFTGAKTDSLNDVSLKVSSSNPIVSLLSAPTGYSTTQSGGLNSSGCNGAGAGYFCSPYGGVGNGLEVGKAGDLYTFVWQVTLGAPGDLFTGSNSDTNEASLKVLYLTNGGGNGGLTSENDVLTKTTSATPEPGSLVLLGTGILGAAGLLKRRLQA